MRVVFYSVLLKLREIDRLINCSVPTHATRFNWIALIFLVNRKYGAINFRKRPLSRLKRQFENFWNILKDHYYLLLPPEDILTKLNARYFFSQP